MIETVASQNAAACLSNWGLLGTIGGWDTKASALGLGEFVGGPSGINRLLMDAIVEGCFFGFIGSLRDFSTAAVALQFVILRLGERAIALPVPLEVGVGG